MKYNIIIAKLTAILLGYDMDAIGNFGYDFIKAHINEMKESQKKIAKLTQHGEKLEISNEYHDFRKKN